MLLSTAAIAQTDTLLHYTMQPVEITAQREWANDTVWYRHTQTKYYVTTILLYVNEAIKLHNELKNFSGTRKETKQLINRREDELKERYKKELKALNETQGVLIIKLVARQTGENLFDLMSEYKNSFYATKWLTWSRIHGFNINKSYNPDDEILLENVMESLGYPLPSFYKERVILTSN